MKKVAIILTVGLFILSGCTPKPKNYEQQKADFEKVMVLFNEDRDLNEQYIELLNVANNAVLMSDIEDSEKEQILKDDMEEVNKLSDVCHNKHIEFMDARHNFIEKYSGEINEFEAYYVKHGGVKLEYFDVEMLKWNSPTELYTEYLRHHTDWMIAHHNKEIEKKFAH